MPKDEWAKARRKDAAKRGLRDAVVQRPKKKRSKRKKKSGVWEPLWVSKKPANVKTPAKNSAMIRALVQCWVCGHHQTRTTVDAAEALRCLKCGGAVELLVVDGVNVPSDDSEESEEDEAARLDSIDARYA